MARFVVALNEAFAGEVITAGEVVAPITGQIDAEGNPLPDVAGYTLPDVITVDWIPALRWAAMTIRELNQYVGLFPIDPLTGESAFPRPIPCNPDAVYWVADVLDAETGEIITPAHWGGEIQKVLGSFNTPPTEDGFITADIDNYEWINFRFLAQMPTSFFYIGGEPKHVGKII
jgi:hypothetical protein